MPDILESVKTYYGSVLQRSQDLKTSACCPTDAMPPHLQEILRLIEPEILEKFYGCGSPIPPALEGRVVLDLGCGSGRDVFLAAKLAGPQGRAIGVDMTAEQLDVARRHLYPQMERLGLPPGNVEFRQGYIEDLAGAGIADESVDVVISNCVINLSPEKERVFAEIFRVLKPGGELYFSDVFADRRIPPQMRSDPVLYGECLAGALYIEDFRRLLRRLGIPDYRVASRSPISLDNPDIERKIGMVNFSSMTIRAFKLDSLEDICEDYGQVAVYEGTLPRHPHFFELDDHHRFQTGKPMLVCGNTAAMLQKTRFAPYFKITGDRSVHYGPFDCGTHLSLKPDSEETGGACGC